MAVDLEQPAAAATAALDVYSQVVSSVAERLTPSVAALQVPRRVRGGRLAQGSGSGVVITPDGHILTSAHVVDGATSAAAILADGRELPAEVVGRDPLSDLAVCRAAPAGLRPGDVIVEVDGRPTADAGDLQRLMMRDELIGRRILLRVVRDHSLIDLGATPVELRD